ncbi:T9SS type A sorting domain-containing protein [Winogradskyella forsetii]|uniref:T9SS type A sorting domain-containing protein n=1 Tax=Winogradskyella forsetii TaxID=2686077 RepID=UPI0015BE5B78|nr:T9SS type A sorting domain-containing protein [Winogradskyella forsetii]
MKNNLTFILIFLSYKIFCQNIAFDLQTGTDFVDVWKSSVAFADIDGDGDEDVLITGQIRNSSQYAAKLYTNDGNGNFSEVLNAPFEGVRDSSVGFADIDGDNDQDLIITGEIRDDSAPVGNHSVISKLYLNDGNGNFSVVPNTPFIGVRESSVSFADVDGDTDIEVLISGSTKPIGIGPNNPSVKLYFNDGQGNFTLTDWDFTQVRESSSDFADVDSDGDMDLYITGETITNTIVGTIYLNDGNGNFSYSQFLEEGINGSVAFSDIDGDTDYDILITGSDDFGRNAKLFKNDGLGNFTWESNTPFESVSDSSIAFSDFDLDGDEDIAITGFAGGGRILKLYENNGNGDYSLVDNLSFSGVYYSSIAFSDVDLDGDKDLLVTGLHDSSVTGTKLYINNSTTLSVYEFNKTNVSIYPNPTNNILNIKSDSTIKYIFIYDTNGRLINTKPINQNNLFYQIDVKSFEQGLYFLEIEQNKTKQIFKFIKS